LALPAIPLDRQWVSVHGFVLKRLAFIEEHDFERCLGVLEGRDDFSTQLLLQMRSGCLDDSQRSRAKYIRALKEAPAPMLR
jgi:hypothetical protein